MEPVGVSVGWGVLDPMDVEVRPAQAEELDAAGQLAAQAYVDDGLLDFGESDRYAAALRDARARAEQAELLVAVEQIAGELAGTVTCTAYGSRYAKLAGPDEGEFRMLAVRIGSRGRCPEGRSRFRPGAAQSFGTVS